MATQTHHKQQMKALRDTHTSMVMRTRQGRGGRPANHYGLHVDILTMLGHWGTLMGLSMVIK